MVDAMKRPSNPPVLRNRYGMPTIGAMIERDVFRMVLECTARVHRSTIIRWLKEEWPPRSPALLADLERTAETAPEITAVIELIDDDGRVLVSRSTAPPSWWRRAAAWVSASVAP